ncbi:uncharacterized protein LOC126990128 isoform X3 [Eriocheir sinensis]|uniref:uncharacterized protein LOC126990128 isoform X3 n=1 Tax=Eriocheir sinensis TaxID=95602 RepID=UPI0021C6A2DA|nr:uncharacterized protein LOC126990128 isoform X3 [Eriocheir sinensis]
MHCPAGDQQPHQGGTDASADLPHAQRYPGTDPLSAAARGLPGGGGPRRGLLRDPAHPAQVDSGGGGRRGARPPSRPTSSATVSLVAGVVVAVVVVVVVQGRRQRRRAPPSCLGYTSAPPRATCVPDLPRVQGYSAPTEGCTAGDVRRGYAPPAAHASRGAARGASAGPPSRRSDGEQRGVVGGTGGAVIGPLPAPPPDQGTDEEQPRHIVRIVTGSLYRQAASDVQDSCDIKIKVKINGSKQSDAAESVTPPTPTQCPHAHTVPPRLHAHPSVRSVVRGQVQARCFHVSPLISTAQKVAMSHLDPGSEMPYPKLQANLDIVQQRLNRPLTLSEKVLYSHLSDPSTKKSSEVSPTTSSSTQTALQCRTPQHRWPCFSSLALDCPGSPYHQPSTVTILFKYRSMALRISSEPLKSAKRSTISRLLLGPSMELDSGSLALGLFIRSFWRTTLSPGTDSHTPNVGGLGGLCIGVGGADAVDVMADISWELKCPKIRRKKKRRKR